MDLTYDPTVRRKHNRSSSGIRASTRSIDREPEIHRSDTPDWLGTVTKSWPGSRSGSAHRTGRPGSRATPKTDTLWQTQDLSAILRDDQCDEWLEDYLREFQANRQPKCPPDQIVAGSSEAGLAGSLYIGEEMISKAVDYTVRNGPKENFAAARYLHAAYIHNNFDHWMGHESLVGKCMALFKDLMIFVRTDGQNVWAENSAGAPSESGGLQLADTQGKLADRATPGNQQEIDRLQRSQDDENYTLLPRDATCERLVNDYVRNVELGHDIARLDNEYVARASPYVLGTQVVRGLKLVFAVVTLTEQLFDRNDPEHERARMLQGKYVDWLPYGDDWSPSPNAAPTVLLGQRQDQRRLVREFQTVWDDIREHLELVGETWIMKTPPDFKGRRAHDAFRRAS